MGVLIYHGMASWIKFLSVKINKTAVSSGNTGRKNPELPDINIILSDSLLSDSL